MDKNNLNKNSEETADPRRRREWIKNIIIVFLLIMLLLTFFSNTIMNYSLPEVSVTRMSRDSVSKKYQLDLLVEANKTYRVTADESRDIKRVAVKRGQDIKEGQALFYLEEVKDSAEAKELSDQIDEMKIAYEKAIMTAAKDYYEYNLAIQQARDTLNNAIAQRDNAANTAPPPDNSGLAAELTQKINSINADLEYISLNQYSSMAAERYAVISQQLEVFTSASDAYDTANTLLVSLQSQHAGNIESDIVTMERELAALETELARLKEDNADQREIEDKQTQINYAKEDLQKVKDLKVSIDDAQKTVNEKLTLKQGAETEFNSKLSELKNSLKSELQTAQSQLSSLGVSGEGAGAVIPESIDYNAAVKAAQYALDAAVHDLEKQMESDRITDAQAQLDLNAQKKKIEEKEADLEELLSKNLSAEITSPVEGVVEEILVTAGQSFNENDELMVINISDDGFTATANLTSEQSKSLTKGKEAKVVNSSDDVTVTIKSIAKDKNDNTKFKVVFSISGDVVAGQNLKIELGESASQFDKVVPKSAVKQDSSGKFVYAVKSKSTPLGNRYLVEKVPVTVVAEDDTRCAVSGDFGESADYIITASSKPFSAGDQVRFSEE